jgi:hypothetical protein
MNVFRLVLCLAGLAIYLLVRQSLHSDSPPAAAPPKPPTGETVPTTGRPQRTPHDEILKSSSTYVAGKNR